MQFLKRILFHTDETNKYAQEMSKYRVNGQRGQASNQSQRNSWDHIKVCKISGIRLLYKQINAHTVSQRYIKDVRQENAPHIKYKEAQKAATLVPWKMEMKDFR